MKSPSFSERLAVCSWSLQPETPQQLIQRLKTLGIPRVQLALDPLRLQPEVWGGFGEMAAKNGIQIVSGMLTTVGEDYSTMELIRLTGGLVPDATWEENWENIQVIAKIAKELAIPLVTFHAGFLPHDERDPEFAKLQHRIRLVADVFAAEGIDLGFETGQERAGTLLEFLEKLKRPNVGVNFDPANMILYDKGNPIEALRILAAWLKQVHLKDANRTKQAGTWGEEVTVGTGEVDWAEFFHTLAELNFNGYCCLEREAGSQRLADIAAGREFVEALE